MRSLSAFVAACFVALAISCAPSKTVFHDVNFDYDLNADFSRLKTYQWVSVPATLRIDEFNRARIQDYVNSEMGARGYNLAEKNPDMFMVMFGGSYKAINMRRLMDYQVYTVGRLKLALYDATSNREIWWGETAADLFHEMTPEEKDSVTKRAVTKILEYFPPKP